jgi:hypothetical protein
MLNLNPFLSQRVLINEATFICEWEKRSACQHRMKGMGVEPSQARGFDFPSSSFFHLHDKI